MAVRTAYDPTAGEILTATNLERLAGGWIGYNETTTGTTSITTVVDLSGLSVAVTAGPSRRIRISGYGQAASASAHTSTIGIQEGATVLQQWKFTGAAGATYQWAPSIVLTPTTGAHTYKITAQSAVAFDVQAAATLPAYILVEDIGPA